MEQVGLTLGEAHFCLPYVLMFASRKERITLR